MILKAFSFLDLKTGSYSQPFFCKHQGEAIRIAIDLGSDRSTQIGRYPQDFEVYEIGAFDQSTGVLESIKPHPLGVVVTYLPSSTKEA